MAQRAGVSHGAVFVHFATRDDLVAAVIGTFAERVIPRMHELVEARASVREVLAAHLTGLAEHEAFYTRLVSEGPLLPPYARSTLVGIQSAISLHLAQAAQREMELGTIRQIPVPMLFNTWLGLVHHYLINRDLFAPGHSVLARHGQELLNHYVALLAA